MFAKFCDNFTQSMVCPDDVVIHVLSYQVLKWCTPTPSHPTFSIFVYCVRSSPQTPTTHTHTTGLKNPFGTPASAKTKGGKDSNSFNMKNKKGTLPRKMDRIASAMKVADAPADNQKDHDIIPSESPEAYPDLPAVYKAAQMPGSSATAGS